MRLHILLLCFISTLYDSANGFEVNNTDLSLSKSNIPCPCEHGICKMKDGSCECEQGWTGILCERAELDQICIGGCGLNGVCDPITKKCICEPGTHGDQCDVCKKGTYGFDCAHKCEDHCRFENVTIKTCEGRSGKCDCYEIKSIQSPYEKCFKSCPSGKIGSQCYETCPEGKFGYNCALDCIKTFGSHGARCNPKMGYSVCKQGYKGFFCTEQCLPGKFGHGCEQSCRNCTNGECHFATGMCQCLPGWKGSSCSEHCENGQFGLNCLKTCSCSSIHKCDPVIGNCTCLPGFTGQNCTETCSKGRWGTNCEQECKCLNGAGCSTVDGTCICTFGWMGETCEKSLGAELLSVTFKFILPTFVVLIVCIILYCCIFSIKCHKRNGNLKELLEENELALKYFELKDNL